MSRLTVKENEFYLNNQKFQILSGAIHYFRCHPDDWEDRLYKLKICGFNTVETVIPWNIHEPEEGKFCFTGFANLERFFHLCTKLGLYMIVRPGPYICGEWDFGGFPSWLLKEDKLELRCSNDAYLNKVDHYFDVLIPMISQYSVENGGPIIAVQIENEYGSYGCDKEYLQYLKEGYERRGLNTLYLTCDGSLPSMLTAGRLEGVVEGINFGSHPKENFAILHQYFGEYPQLCMEYWLGWFDHWGQKHRTRSIESVVEDIRYMKEQGISFNVYLFYGGTNFGLMNGANYNEEEGYQPTITSYDYDALLSEDGTPTPKYDAIKQILNPEVNVKFTSKRKKYEDVIFTECARLFSNMNQLAVLTKSAMPQEFYQGFMLYKAIVQGKREKQPIRLLELHDRAQVFIDGKEEAVYYREEKETSLAYLEINDMDEKKEIIILVENMGRVNYGPFLKERKGILNGVFLGKTYGSLLHGFENYELRFEQINELSYEPFQYYKEPVFLKGELIAKELEQTFLDMRGFQKGVVFINGFCLGRYWEVGPQRDLYIPKGLLKEGKNELIVFELHSYQDHIAFSDSRVL